MKRKDWISSVAMLTIIGIAMIGELIYAKGEWLNAGISLCLKIIPLLVFFIAAVALRHRQGSYVQWWRTVSYVTFIIAVFFLLRLSWPFMHYFNIISGQDKITRATELILSDCNEIFNAYETQGDPRVSSYQSKLQATINQGQYKVLKKAFPTIDFNGMNQQEKEIFVKKTVTMWEEGLYANHAVNKDNLKSEQEPKFRKQLISDFNIFKAAENFEQLIEQYQTYKTALTEDFSNKTFFEEEEGYDATLQFIDNGSAWKDAGKMFAEMNFNFAAFLLFLPLAIIACSAYIFFKDSNVKSPRTRKGYQPIYESGHKLS